MRDVTNTMRAWDVFAYKGCDKVVDHVQSSIIGG